MSDDSSAGQGRETGRDAEPRGASEVPEESPSSESDLALSQQAAEREQDDEQDTE